VNYFSSVTVAKLKFAFYHVFSDSIDQDIIDTTAYGLLTLLFDFLR